MKKVFVFAISALALFGAGDSRNIEAYKMHCKVCHGAAYKGAAMKTELEWVKLFEDDAKELKSLHKNEAEAMKTMNESRFNKDAKRMINFLKANSQDSGAVRACDGINCG